MATFSLVCIVFFIFILLRLGEEKPALIEGIVSKFGKTVAHTVYKLTQAKEVDGGIEINVSLDISSFVLPNRC